MSLSLRDRLLGRSTNGTNQGLNPGGPGTGANGNGNGNGAGQTSDSGGSSMMLSTSMRQAEAILTPVDQLKVELHRRLIERLDLEALERIEDQSLVTLQIRQAVTELLRGESTPLSTAEREEVVEQIVYEVTGLGPIEPLFRDRAVTDILINGPKNIYIERGGRLSRSM
jgi:pilus assembly protein CpaF